MQTVHHIWRTSDGRHVLDGHPDAAILAYAAGDQIPDHVADEVGVKMAARPEDKAKPKPEDKAVKVDTKAALLREAEDHGITVDKRLSAPRLREAIDAALASRTEMSDEGGTAEENEDGEEE